MLHASEKQLIKVSFFAQKRPKAKCVHVVTYNTLHFNLESFIYQMNGIYQLGFTLL